jgi:hypothetical protein
MSMPDEADAASQAPVPEGSNAELFFGLLLGYMFGILAICCIFAAQQGRASKKFKNGIYGGFMLRFVISMYMINK